MNEVKISGAFERGVEMDSVNRGGDSLPLCRGSLTYLLKRDDGEKRQWVEVECVGKAAFEMADIPMNVGLTITGELRRAAWKDERGEWQSRHFVYYRSHELNAAYVEQAPPPVDDDIPF